MNKKFSIEVPIYSNSVEYLAEVNKHEDIDIVMYGGVPNSPLNGGRANYCLDGFFLWNRFFFRLSKKQLERVWARFYETLTMANQSGISFRAALTNMFVSREECCDENLSLVAWLVEASGKYGVKNGLILNNKLLEDAIRQKYGDKLVYVSSCTKYVSPERILGPNETLRMYLEDSGKYDFICLTPQDSRREALLKEAAREKKSGIIAICNSYCADTCNSYYHYEYMSKENKRSLLTLGTIPALARAFAFTLPRAPQCPALRQAVCGADIRKLARMQLEAGIVHFKLGRGFGAERIGLLVSEILDFQNGRQNNGPGGSAA
jgi:hypothetical protein